MENYKKYKTGDKFVIEIEEDEPGYFRIKGTAKKLIWIALDDLIRVEEISMEPIGLKGGRRKFREVFDGE